jgi:hypothetical protein
MARRPTQGAVRIRPDLKDALDVLDARQDKLTIPRIIEYRGQDKKPTYRHATNDKMISQWSELATSATQAGAHAATLRMAEDLATINDASFWNIFVKEFGILQFDEHDGFSNQVYCQPQQYENTLNDSDPMNGEPVYAINLPHDDYTHTDTKYNHPYRRNKLVTAVGQWLDHPIRGSGDTNENNTNPGVRNFHSNNKIFSSCASQELNLKGEKAHHFIVNEAYKRVKSQYSKAQQDDIKVFPFWCEYYFADNNTETTTNEEIADDADEKAQKKFKEQQDPLVQYFNKIVKLDLALLENRDILHSEVDRLREEAFWLINQSYEDEKMNLYQADHNSAALDRTPSTVRAYNQAMIKTIDLATYHVGGRIIITLWEAFERANNTDQKNLIRARIKAIEAIIGKEWLKPVHSKISDHKAKEVEPPPGNVTPEKPEQHDLLSMLKTIAEQDSTKLNAYVNNNAAELIVALAEDLQPRKATSPEDVDKVRHANIARRMGIETGATTSIQDRRRESIAVVIDIIRDTSSGRKETSTLEKLETYYINHPGARETTKKAIEEVLAISGKHYLVAHFITSFERLSEAGKAAEKDESPEIEKHLQRSFALYQMYESLILSPLGRDAVSDLEKTIEQTRKNIKNPPEGTTAEEHTTKLTALTEELTRGITLLENAKKGGAQPQTSEADPGAKERNPKPSRARGGDSPKGGDNNK